MALSAMKQASLGSETLDQALGSLTFNEAVCLLESLIGSKMPGAGPRLQKRMQLVVGIFADENQMALPPTEWSRRERLRGAATWALDHVSAEDSSLTASTLRMAGAAVLRHLGPFPEQQY